MIKPNLDPKGHAASKWKQTLVTALLLGGLAVSTSAQEVLLTEDFNSDGEGTRYVTEGAGLSEEANHVDNGIGVDQTGPVFWTRSSDVSIVGVPGPTPARRVILAWDAAIPADQVSAEFYQLFDATAKWLLKDKANATVILAPAGIAPALSARLEAAGHTIVDDDPSVPADQVAGDLIIRGNGAGDSSRFATTPIPMIAFSGGDADDLLISTIGVTQTFEAGNANIVTAGHPAAGGLTGSLPIATGSYAWETIGALLPIGATTLATMERVVPPSAASIADVEALADGSKQSNSANQAIGELDIWDNIDGDWFSDWIPPGDLTGVWGLKATGQLTVSTSGTYSFAIGVDDGARLRIDGDANGFDDGDTVLSGEGVATYYGDKQLNAGTYDYEILAYNSGGDGRMEASVSLIEGGGDTSPIADGNWDLLGQATGAVKLAGPANVTSYEPSGPPETQNLPFIVLINGPDEGGNVYGGGPFGEFEGDAFFAGSALNKFVGDDGIGTPKVLTLNPVNVSGKSDLFLTFLASATYLDFETGDYLDFQVGEEGDDPANFTTLVHFTAPSGSDKYFDNRSTQPGSVTQLGLPAQQVSVPIPDGFNNLVVRVEALTTWWNEIVGFDNIRVTSGAVTPPAGGGAGQIAWETPNPNTTAADLIGGGTVTFSPFEYDGGNAEGTFFTGGGGTTGNPDLDAVYNSHGWNGAGASITLSGLTAGESYQVQLLGAGDTRGCCDTRNQAGDDGQGNVSGDFERGNTSVIGSFTAAGATQDIMIVSGTANGVDPGLSGFIVADASGAVVSAFNVGRTAGDDITVGGGGGVDLEAGLVAHWGFDGTLGDSIASHDGVAQGPVGFVDGQAGFGQAISLDGAGYVEIMDSATDLDFAGGSLSISGWFTVGAFDKNWQALIAKGEQSAYRVARRGGENSIAYAGGVGEGANDAPDVNDGGWHHFVAVSDASATEFGTALYVDGVRYEDNATAPALEAEATNLFIGENPEALNRQWIGLIDDIGLWDRVLSADEVTALYAGGTGLAIGSLPGVDAPAGFDGITADKAAGPALAIPGTGLNGEFWQRPVFSILTDGSDVRENGIDRQIESFGGATGTFTATEFNYLGNDLTPMPDWLAGDAGSYSGPAGNLDDGAFRFSGFLNIAAAGTINIGTTSDDGSRINIAGTDVLDNDNGHGNTTVDVDVAFEAAGVYPIEVTYFNGDWESGGLHAGNPDPSVHGGANFHLRINGSDVTSAELDLFFTTPNGVPAADKGNIVFVSFHDSHDTPDGDATAAGLTEPSDKAYTDLLQANGYSVTRFLTMNDADVSSIGSADLVIISRAVASGGFQQANETATWNGVSNPVMILGGYILRNSRLGLTTGGTMVDTVGDVRLTVNDPSHPIFAGISLDANNTMANVFAGVEEFNGTVQRGVSVNNDPPAGNGMVLATIGTAGDPAAGGMVIGEWAAGSVQSNGGADVLAGPRVVFLTGSREASGLTSHAAGFYDLEPDGEQMFLNAVAYAVGLGGGGGPEISGITLSGTDLTFEWSGGGALETATSITGPWTEVAGASSPHTTPATGAGAFFRVRQ